jgi:hypothetical protein
MSDVLNKYKQLHADFIDLLVEYNNRHTDFIQGPTVRNTAALRKVIKKMRVVQRDLWQVSQETCKDVKAEKRIEWGRPPRDE